MFPELLNLAGQPGSMRATPKNVFASSLNGHDLYVGGGDDDDGMRGVERFVPDDHCLGPLLVI